MWPFHRKKSKVPTPEEVMRETGMSEEELTRSFMIHLIQQEKNPFEALPDDDREKAKQDYPDIADLARKKFGDF